MPAAICCPATCRAWKNGNPLRLKDVAVIVDDAENLRLAAWSDTAAGVILNVQRQPGANVIQTVDRVKALLPKLQASLPASIDVQVIADRTTTIRASVRDTQFELLLAIALVVLMTLANLVSAPNLFWSLGPSLAASIFDGGQRKLASAQARSSADVATSNYRQAVLTALQEVEDNLVLADQLQQGAQLQAEASQSAQRTLEITLDQYRAGTVGYLNVAAAQSAALNSEISLLSVRNRQLAAVNQLLKNIAGRWEAV